MSADPNPNPAPKVPPPSVVLQSLSPTTLTGTVIPPQARTASVAIPPPSVAIPTPSLPRPLSYAPGLAEEQAGETAVEMGEPADAAPVLIGKPPRRNPFVEYWRKVGGGSLTLSLLVHAGLIAGFVAIVTVTVHEPKVDFLPGGGSTQSATASQELAHQVQQKKRTALNKSTPLSRVVSNSGNAAITLPDVPVDALDVPDLAIPMASSSGFASALSGGGFGTGQGLGAKSGATFTSLPASMKSRCSAVERLQKLKENGGSPECEKAVSAALEYLKTKQKADGSWGTAGQGAMTGFALLCYFGRCETPDSVFYGENIMKGILYLIELQKKNKYSLISVDPESTGAAYEHGIATYALGEMYALARLGSKSLPGMREAFETGVKVIIENQNETGGWDYYGRNLSEGKVGSKRNDLSVSGWNYQALKAAKLSGLNIPNLYKAIDKCAKYLEGTQTREGGFGSPNREAGYNQWNLTGVSVLGLQTLGHGKTAQIKKGVKWAYDFHQKEPPTWENVNLYAWYYYAQIYFQNGGPEFKYWNEIALPEILKHQGKDGSWSGAGATAGGDKIFSTALCTLMLEVYYRYLKVGDREEGSVFDRAR
jgi:hypothetical protein